MQHLQPNSTLQGGKYRIERVLGQGGFGITYLAENTMLEGKVAIKEFFFKEYCNREDETSRVIIPTEGNIETVERFKQKFVKEARTIFKLNHANIVRILDVFEEHGTAYYVMDYIEGESLGDMLKRRDSIPEAEAIGYIKEVASALSYIHGKRMNHLDIKPGNIMKRMEDGKILVIDFGVAKQYDAETSEGTTTTPVGISHGYSPAEQYLKNGVQTFSPQSDVYALAATLYKLLTGITPPEAMVVQDEGLSTEYLKAKGVSTSVIDAIDAAMQSRRKRTQSIDEFVDEISHTTTSCTTSVEEETIIIGKEKSAEETIYVVPDKSDSTEFYVNGVRFSMIKVEGGTFDMKETADCGFLGLSSKEIVQRTTLSDYCIGETQVTQALWTAVMGNNPSRFKGDNLPVECVSWDDCQKFIKALNEKTGKTFRLPTEAEWEFAARGGKKSRGYEYSGSDNIGDVAWYSVNSEYKTREVAKKQPNELGIYDMSGNVWEWCNDWYAEYSNYPQTNPTGPKHGSYRVLRGGSWNSFVRGCRSSFRLDFTPGSSDGDLGLRLVLVP